MITFVSIATNLYINYWEDLVASFCSQYSLDEKIRFVCLTDRNSRKIPAHPNVEILLMPVKPMVWPEATVKRYRHILDVTALLAPDSSHIAYIDADTKFHDANGVVAAIQGSKGLAFVSHPSYAALGNARIGTESWRRSWLIRLLNGGLGEWEMRRESSAFVPIWHRRHYVYGAFWFGERAKIMELCRTLADNVDRDEEFGIMARWHDESHLNRAFVYTSEKTLLGPEFCADLSSDLGAQVGEVLIEAVNKDQRTR